METIIGISVLFIIIGAFVYHDHMEWNKLTKEAVKTQRCPFCGIHLHQYNYEDKSGAYTAYTCPTCEFSTSLKREKDIVSER